MIYRIINKQTNKQEELGARKFSRRSELRDKARPGDQVGLITGIR